MDQEASKTSTWTAKKTAVAAGLGVLLILGGVAAYDTFAPKPTTTLDQDLGEGVGADNGDAMTGDTMQGDAMGADFTALRSGTFEGADAIHHVSGTVTVYDGPDGHFLRLEDYEATSGPDVFFVLSTTPEGSYDEGETMRVLVPGGAEGGQATVRGNFNVPLPADFDPAKWNSIIVWCHDFSAKFGGASLS